MNDGQEKSGLKVKRKLRLGGLGVSQIMLSL